MTAKQVQIRRDSATNLNAATPADGELGYDTTNDELRIGDGSTAGGIHIPNSKMIQSQTYISGTAGGTADALTLTISPAPAAYVTLQRFVFKASATNATTTPTLTINALTAKTIKKKSSSGVAALAAGDIQNGCVYTATYDGTYFQLECVDIAPGGAGLTTITSGSFGAVTLLDITSIPQTYRGLVLYINGASNSVATRALNIDIDTGNGLGSGSNNYNYKQISGITVSEVAAANSGQLWTAVTQTAAQVTHVQLTIYNYQSGPVKEYHARVLAAGTSGSFTGTSIMSDGLMTDSGTARTGAVVGIRITWDTVSSGVFDAGTYALYGVN